MATRRMATLLGDVSFDHGAQYFTAMDPGFKEQVQVWADAGVVGRWAAAGGEAWVGIPAMNAPLKAMASGMDVRWATRATTLSRTSTGWAVETDDGNVLSADALVTALPAEQTADLLATLALPVAGTLADAARARPSAPCWTVMLAFAERLASVEDCVRGTDADALGWAARNSSKPGRGGLEAWVIQAGADWSVEHLEALPAEVEARLMEALSVRLGMSLPAPLVQASHRWRFARSDQAGAGGFWDSSTRLGVCGDWLLGSKVEDAWRSGTHLARSMAADLG